MGKGKQSILPRSIYGNELKQICGINDVTLRDWVVNYELTAYHWKTFYPLQKREDFNLRTSVGVSTLEEKGIASALDSVECYGESLGE
jgi:hypothetical protein